jgi:hypothetical protein
MEVSTIYPWQETYFAAILETENARLRKRIDAAQASIRARIEELSMDHGGTPEEREALNSAIRGLKLLAKERTGEPEGCALREPVYGMQ